MDWTPILPFPRKPPRTAPPPPEGVAQWYWAWTPAAVRQYNDQTVGGAQRLTARAWFPCSPAYAAHVLCTMGPAVVRLKLGTPCPDAPMAWGGNRAPLWAEARHGKGIE